MMKKRGILLVGIFFILLVVFFISQVYSIEDMGSISLIILPSSLQIYIHAPLNETINMVNVGCNGPFIVELNVSANFDVDSWWYTIEDLKYNQVQSDVPLPKTTNTTSVTNISAFRWQNRLTIFANESTGIVVNKSVVFYVNVSNHAPIFGTIPDSLYACESTNYDYIINATDCDEDSLTFGGSSDDPFFILSPNPKTENIIPNLGMFGESKIFSLPLNKSNININYSLSATVTDTHLIDVKNVNVSVIEINNPPQYSVFIPGANTVWTKGENSTFIREFNATDVEDGNQDSGNLSYNISFLGTTLFGITNQGKVSYIGNIAHLGNHFATVCVTDKGIPLSHPKIQEVCGQDGSNQSNCVTFQLTVVNQNRPPTITSFNPKNLSFPSFSTDNLHFNITTFDPDGTIPDVFWYVNGQLTKYDNLTSISQFNYNFGCGVSGKQNIRVDITDGELNDSLQWNVPLIGIACPITPPGGGSGGGGGGASNQCTPIWGCHDWNVCQNAARSLDVGALSGGDYRTINNNCTSKEFDKDTCGFQIRNCFDVASCNLTRNKPAEIQSCIFTINPSCLDGIKNCHSGSCEFLVDCGGPCGACATCTDKKQNQGEQGIDCGGPCPFSCPVETGQSIKFFDYFIWLLVLLLIIAIILFYRVHKLRKKLKQE